MPHKMAIRTRPKGYQGKGDTMLEQYGRTRKLVKAWGAEIEGTIKERALTRCEQELYAHYHELYTDDESAEDA